MLVKRIAAYTHLSSTVYELYWSEIATFSYPLHLTPPLGVFALEFREKVWASEVRKLESWGYQAVKTV